MAKVNGLKEKFHFPLYDAFFVPGKSKTKAAKKLNDVLTDKSAIRFFVDIHNKTKLETNLLEASVLPNLNAFECIAIKVWLSPLKKMTSKVNLANSVENEFSRFIKELNYNSVTTVIVNKTVRFQMPTFLFASGMELKVGSGVVNNQTSNDSIAAYRFSEPIIIPPQESFRVEIQFPRGLPRAVGTVIGPMRIWVVLDGYATRDIQ